MEKSQNKINWKLVIGLIIIAGSVIYLLISSTIHSMQYFITIDELLRSPEKYKTKTVRVSGAVIGSTIHIDKEKNTVSFTVANISSDHQKLDEEGALADAVNDLTANHLSVIYKGVKPDLLKDQSQAIISGTIDDNQVFHADELLLKCPSKYEQKEEK